jgi:hypothetical protein
MKNETLKVINDKLKDKFFIDKKYTLADSD